MIVGIAVRNRLTAFVAAVVGDCPVAGAQRQFLFHWCPVKRVRLDHALSDETWAERLIHICRGVRLVKLGSMIVVSSGQWLCVLDYGGQVVLNPRIDRRRREEL